MAQPSPRTLPLLRHRDGTSASPTVRCGRRVWILGRVVPCGIRVLWVFVVALAAGCRDGGEQDDASTTKPLVADPIAVGLDSTDAKVVEVLRERIEAARMHPESGSHRGTLGLAYEANGYDVAALESYRQAEALAGDAFEWAPTCRAILLQQQARFDEALERMDRALEIDPGLRARLALGVAIGCSTWTASMKRRPRSRMALTWGPARPPIVGQARIHLRRGNAASALELLEPLSETLDHPLVFRVLGRALRDLGRVDEARLALGKGREARQLTWEDPVLDRRTAFIAGFGGRMLQAESLVASGDAAEALPILEELVVDWPEHANASESTGRGVLAHGGQRQVVGDTRRGRENAHRSTTRFT